MFGIVCIGAFCTACFSAFLDYCMEEDEILGWYRKLIKKIKPCWLQNPIGGCVICMNVWLSFLSFVFLGLPFWWVVPYISISFVFLMIILRLTDGS